MSSGVGDHPRNDNDHRWMVTVLGCPRDLNVLVMVGAAEYTPQGSCKYDVNALGGRDPSNTDIY